MQYLLLILILPVWIWSVFGIPHILSAGADAILKFDRELTIFDPPESSEWLLYLPGWVAGWLIATEITSSLSGFALVSALVGGSLGGLVRFVLGTTPHGLALLSGLILLCPVLGYVLGAWLTHTLVVQHWYSLGTPPAAAVRLVDVNLDQLLVQAQDGRNYSCCTALGAWRSGRLESASQAHIVPCSASETGWRCPALRHFVLELPGREMTPIPPAPSNTATLYHFSLQDWRPGTGSAYETYGGVALQADGSVWEWRRITGSGVRNTPHQLLNSKAADKVLLGGMLGVLGGGLFVSVISGALRLRVRLRQASRP